MWVETYSMYNHYYISEIDKVPVRLHAAFVIGDLENKHCKEPAVLNDVLFLTMLRAAGFYNHLHSLCYSHSPF